jgi:hypothetical protein
LRWAVLVARLREKRNACKVLTGNPEGKALIERLKRRWGDNIKIRCESVDCVDLVQGRNM